MVEHPLGRLVEKGRAGVYVDGVSFDHGAVTFLGILLGSVCEISRHDRASDLVVVSARGQDFHLRIFVLFWKKEREIKKRQNNWQMRQEKRKNKYTK